jgi:3'-5' exoribonuclease
LRPGVPAPGLPTDYPQPGPANHSPVTAPIHVPTLGPGKRVQDPFLVHGVETHGGAYPHTVLSLGNSTGKIDTEPFWSEDAPKIAGIAKGMVVQVVGEVAIYRGTRRQLRVSSIRPLPDGSIEVRRLLPRVGDVGPYWGPLDRWRSEIRGPRLRAVLGLLYDDPAFRAQYENCPGSTSGHHAALGGLLKHTAEVATIARAIGRAAGADGDLLLAGVLLHDIGKLEAYRWDGVFEGTELNALNGHIVLGALRLDRTVRRVEPMPCTEQELSILTHLILSHHGRLEFGAAVPPLTLEAEILHWADNASARSASMADALRDSGNFDEEKLLSAPVWQVDRRRVYRGRSDWGAE